jgi:hypothetical protein
MDVIIRLAIRNFAEPIRVVYLDVPTRNPNMLIFAKIIYALFVEWKRSTPKKDAKITHVRNVGVSNGNMMRFAGIACLGTMILR